MFHTLPLLLAPFLDNTESILKVSGMSVFYYTTAYVSDKDAACILDNVICISEQYDTDKECKKRGRKESGSVQRV